MSDERDDELHPAVDRLFDGVQPTPGVDVAAALEAVTARAATVRRLRRVRRIGAAALVAAIVVGATTAIVAAADDDGNEVVAGSDPAPPATEPSTTTTGATSAACPDLAALGRELPAVVEPGLPVSLQVGTGGAWPPLAPPGASTPVTIVVELPDAHPSWQDEAVVDRWDGRQWVATYALFSLFGAAPGWASIEDSPTTDDGAGWRETSTALAVPADTPSGIYRLRLEYQAGVLVLGVAHVVFGIPCSAGSEAVEGPPDAPTTTASTTSPGPTATVAPTTSAGPPATTASPTTTESPTTSSSDLPTATTIAPPPEGSGPARWELAPGQAVDAATTSFVANVTELTCSSGRSADGRVLPPLVVVSADRVVVTFRVAPATTATSAGDPPTTVTCPSNPPSAYTVTLPEPLGDRLLVDGASGEPRAG